MCLCLAHLWPVESEGARPQVESRHQQCGQLPNSETVIEQQRHDNGIPAPLWGVRLHLECCSLLIADRDRQRFLSALPGRLAPLVDASSILPAITLHGADHRRIGGVDRAGL